MIYLADKGVKPSPIRRGAVTITGVPNPEIPSMSGPKR